MSTEEVITVNEERRMGVTLLFLAVLALSMFWPDPAIWINERTLDLPLLIDHHESFGREPRQWDVPIWYLFGFVFIELLAGRGAIVRSTARSLWVDIREFPRALVRRLADDWKQLTLGVAAAGGVLALSIVVLDPLIVGWLSSVPEIVTQPMTRPLNELGGGSSPTIVILFLIAAGLGWGAIDVARQGVSISAVAVLAAIPMGLAKNLTARARPEEWEGPLRWFSGGDSFPSGHAVSAFVIAAVIWFSRAHSLAVRIGVLIVASLVALSRVLTFRHWPSDVIGSALLAIMLAWIVVPAFSDAHRRTIDVERAA